MWSTAREVAAGDTVIVWLTRDQIQALVVTPGRDFNTKFGNFRQDDFLGVPYGSKVPSKAGRGFVHLLRPTPELWTLALPHRTQILYLADIAFITAQLHIRPGATVIEAGTGSASFSHSVARTLGPAGRLFSFEFHEARFRAARAEFARHGLTPAVSLTHRNVCRDGFAPATAADAVFLDLPAPWDAVPHAKAALRTDRPARICCFSPCVEQVLRTVAALNAAGFTEITTYETLLRPHEVFQAPPPPSVGPLAARLKHAEVRREEKRQRQIAANRAQAAAAARAAGAGAPDADADADVDMQLEAETDADADADAKNIVGAKRKHPAPSTPPSTSLHPNPNPDADADADDPDLDGETAHKRPRTGEASSSTAAEVAPPPAPARVNVAKVLPEVRGHTSYLTFACLVPVPAGVAAAAAAAEAASATTTTDADADTVPAEAAVKGPDEDADAAPTADADADAAPPS